MPRGIEILNLNNLNLANTDWQDQGACRNYPADWWLPNSSKTPKGTKSPGAKAREICRTECKVKDICLDWILHIEAQDGNLAIGIYGGCSVSERGLLRLCQICSKPVAKRPDKQRENKKPYTGACCSPECDTIRDQNYQSRQNSNRDRNGHGEANKPTTFYKQGRIA